MSKAITILVADDEEQMRTLLRTYLEREKYVVDEAENGYEVLEKHRVHSYDLILLDIMMPELDGFSTCIQLRKTSNVPIIFLTALGEELDRVHGLRIGGDDYLVKPFSLSELMARIEAVLRRTMQKQESNQEVLSFGQLHIYPKGRSVYVNDHEVVLTPKEFDLLYFLAKHNQQAFTREQILDHIWGFDFAGQCRTVDTHVKTIRIKLGAEGKRLKTVWGVGYKFEASP